MRTIAMIALAAALGLTWVGAAIPADVKEKAREVKEDTKDAARDAKEATKDKAETTKDKMKSAGETTKDKMKSAGETTKDKLVETKDKIKEKVNGHKEPAMQRAGSDNVRAAQQSLKAKGYDPGPVDGLMGPRTRAAVTEFQKKEGLKANGQLDADTRTKLGMTQTSGVQQPAPGAMTGTTGSPGPAASPATAPPSEAPPTQKP